MRDTFRKTGPESAFDMFEAEADGLSELGSAGAVRVPEVAAVGTTRCKQLLGLEFQRQVEVSVGSSDRAVERVVFTQIWLPLSCLRLSIERMNFSFFRSSMLR